ncbi:MAG: FAD-binding oxidoreductase [Verrucomicrobia bacterium]|nr:FAD-binding oxidoreductase [Verrucomicrobiota bacterium]
MSHSKQQDTRRKFLKRGLGAVAGLVMANGCSFYRDVTPPLDSQAISRLRSNFKGRLIVPGDKLYESLSLIYHRSSSKKSRPALVAQCANSDDVLRSIELAVNNRLPLAVRGGGHSYAQWATCDGGLVIDLSPMKEIVVDTSTNTARIGAGVLGSELVAQAGRYNLVPVVGQCPTVGVTGFTLGGGLSYLSGLYGAACDNLLAAQVVSPDVGSVTANAEQRQDLFWALRGGGGNFGVATSVTHQLRPLPSVTAGKLVYDFGDVRAVLRGYNEVMTSAPDGIQGWVLAGKTDKPFVFLVVVMVDDSPEMRTCLKSLRSIAKPLDDTIKPMPYAETYSIDEYTPMIYRSTKGSYLQRFSEESVDLVVDQIMHNSGASVAVGFDHFMHGAVCRVPKEATAFELRDPGAMHLWITSGWNDAAHEQIRNGWIRDTWEKLQPFSGGQAYANYPGADNGKDVRTVYRGNFARLAAIKAKYDSNNVLRRNFNITPRT